MIRFLKTLIQAFFREPLDFEGVSRIHARVWPGDLDVNVHMNNGRYLTAMDWGRWDFLVRSALFNRIFHKGWRPVLGSSLIIYRKSLQPFQKFAVETQVIGWDDKWFYMDQKIMSGGEVYCYAYVKGLFIRQGKKVTIHEMKTELGIDHDSPLLPEAVLTWRKAENILKEQSK